MRDTAVKWLRLLLPRKLITGCRFFWIYNSLRGHSRCDRNGFCLGGDGKPVPWITYPAIDFLGTLDFSQAHVFEYGTGSSTVWWSTRSAAVAGVEFDRSWYEKIRSLGLPNTDIRHCSDVERYAATINNFEENFDVIVIDGTARYRCAQQAVLRLRPGGLIVLDNTEWLPEAATMLRNHGLLQIDFTGFAPLNAFPSVTSLFISRDTEWLNRKRLLNWVPPGGKPKVSA